MPLIRVNLEDSDDECNKDNEVPALLRDEDFYDKDNGEGVVYFAPKVEEVHTAVEGFTEREVMRAKRAWKLLHDLLAPSYGDLKILLCQNMIKNCPVNLEDVKLDTKIFGKDGLVVKGKNTRPRPPVVMKDGILDLLEELQIKETELAVDVMFIENQASVHSLD